MKLITHSLMRSQRTCPRKRHFEYNLGYRSVIEIPALEFGSLAHLLLECYWLARKHGRDPMQALIEKFKAIKTSDPVDRIRLRAMICAYVAVWSRVECEVLAVEAEFKAPLLDPKTGIASEYWTRSGKIDLLIRFPNGVVVLVEHKTSAADVGPGSTYRNRLSMDEQVSFYLEGSKAIGFDPQSIIYDILRKPKHTPKLATPEEDRTWTKVTKANPVSRLYKGQREFDEPMEEFALRMMEEMALSLEDWIVRIPLYRGTKQLTDFMKDVWSQAEVMKSLDETDGHYPNSDACGGGYSGFGCQFREVCQEGAELSNPFKFRLLKNVHPELDGEAAAVAVDAPVADGFMIQQLRARLVFAADADAEAEGGLADDKDGGSHE